MTTPNEDLILKLRGQAYTTCRPDQLCDQAADLLQSQAERIAELVEKIAGRTDYALSLRRRLDTARMESHTLRAQLAAIAATEPVDVVLTFNYGQLVKVHIADHTLYEVDLSPKPYFQVCWAHGWAGIYSSEDEAAEDCLSLCGHGRSIREIKPGDDGYRNPNAINLIEQRFPVSQPLTHPMPAESKDAERYRWLRDYLISPSTHFDDLIVSADKADILDGVIDAARAKGAKQ